MEAIGLLVTLEARQGKEADAEALPNSAQPLAEMKKDFEMVCLQPGIGMREFEYTARKRNPFRNQMANLFWPQRLAS
jgi:hypothetical protein